MRETARRLILALYRIDEAYYLNENKKKLSDAELCIMYALNDGNAHSQVEISREWLVPKTTVSTIAKRWEKDGYLTMSPIPGKRREMSIKLSESGEEYAAGFMSFLYKAEDKALSKTLERYSEEFIEALEYFGESLQDAFEEVIREEADDNGVA